MKNDELKIIEFEFPGCSGSRWCYFLFLRKNISPESSELYQLRSSSIKRSFYQAAGLYQERSDFISSEAAPSSVQD